MPQNDNTVKNLMTKLQNDTIIIFVVIGILAIATAFLYTTSLIFNPFFLLLIIPAWVIYSVSRQMIKRRVSLNRLGYFGGGCERGACVYEEYVNGKLLKLKVKLENTEPGHWELFVPNESEWRSYVPEWAKDRRIEIIERIKPYYKASDIHFPSDFKKKDDRA